MFPSFFTTIFRGSPAVFCAVTIPPADLRSLSSYYYAVCGRMCMSSLCVFGVLVCWWSACEHARCDSKDHSGVVTKALYLLFYWEKFCSSGCRSYSLVCGVIEGIVKRCIQCHVGAQNINTQLALPTADHRRNKTQISIKPYYVQTLCHL